MSARDALTLLDELLDLDDASRAVRLAQIQADDAALADRLRRWLAADAREDERVDRRWVNVLPSAAPTAAADDRIGAYRLVRELGRGGMGQVWLAERADGGFVQEVALKLVRQDSPSPDAEARFRRERDILAALEHPHIARLLDGGALPDGRAWFALEYVRGEVITRWSDARNASIEIRLRLMLQVCAAAQHAHRNLVVHRDLKPSNILVDDSGAAKLLDFGIAKVLAQDGVAGDTNLMTPEYAAPEQLSGGPVTTATDIHALGLVMFELLAGEHPFRDTGPTPFAIARSIAEREAPRLSSRAYQDPTRAVHMGLGVRRLRERLRGDLDAIVARCLEKEPSRRYSSVAALGEDIERHLQHRPVSARSGRGYRFVRLLRRHVIAVSAAVLIVAVLAAATVVSRREAAIASREATRAQREAATATAVKDFLLQTFRSANPYETGGRTVTARDLLESGAGRIDAELADAPRVRAELHEAFGDTFARLDRIEQARASYGRALAIYRELGLQSTPQALGIEVGVFTTRYEAAEFAGLDRDIRAFLSRSDPRDPAAAAMRLEAWSLLTMSLWSQGRYDEASRAAHDFVAEAERANGRVSDSAGFAWYTRALIELDRGRWLQASEAMEKFVAIDIALLPPEHPGLVTDVQLVARLFDELGQPERALPLALAAREARLAHFGPEHRLSVSALARVASVEAALGRQPQAGEHFRQALEQMIRLVGPDHDDVATLRELMVVALVRQGDVVSARQQLLAAARVWRRIGGDTHPRYLSAGAAIEALREDSAHRLRARARLEAIAAAQRLRDDAGLVRTLRALQRWSELDADTPGRDLLRQELAEVERRRSGGDEALAAAARLQLAAEGIVRRRATSASTQRTGASAPD